MDETQLTNYNRANTIVPIIKELKRVRGVINDRLMNEKLVVSIVEKHGGNNAFKAHLNSVDIANVINSGILFMYDHMIKELEKEFKSL